MDSKKKNRVFDWTRGGLPADVSVAHTMHSAVLAVVGKDGPRQLEGSRVELKVTAPDGQVYELVTYLEEP